MPAATRVDVLIVTYLPGAGLEAAVESVLEQGVEAQVLVAVNNTTVVEPILAPLRAKWRHEPVRFVSLGRNLGFAGGVNEGLQRCASPFVLLLNDDAVLQPECLRRLLGAFSTAGEALAGVSPKTLLRKPEGVIDNLGAGVHASGWISNRGVGELDIGQYDALGLHPVIGLCFAAALIRRSVFDSVGFLEDSYFMYAEDAEWCLRARAQGYTFLVEPSAVAVHEHSSSTSTMAADWKSWLIRRNTLLTVLALFPTRQALRFLRDRLREEVASAVDARTPSICARHLGDLARRAPRTASRRARLRLKIRRENTQDFLHQLEADCRDFNEVSEDGLILPLAERRTLRTMYSRRARNGDSSVLEILDHSPSGDLERALAPLVEADGPGVIGLVRRIAEREQLSIPPELSR